MTEGTEGEKNVRIMALLFRKMIARHELLCNFLNFLWVDSGHFVLHTENEN